MNNTIPEPKMAYVVVDSRFGAIFSAPTFERAAERANALMRGESESVTLGNPGYYRIVRVEAE